MLGKWAAALAALLLQGCTGLPDWNLFAFDENKPSVANPGEFDFAWRLSGEPSVGPIQVFDNGRQMWLQFAPDQPVPAVFARTSGGDRLLEYRREGPYVVLDRVWPQLILRGGLQSSQVDRVGQTSKTPLRPQAAAQPQESGATAATAFADSSSGVQPQEAVSDTTSATPAVASASPSISSAHAAFSDKLSALTDTHSVVAKNIQVDAAPGPSSGLPETTVPVFERTYEVSPQDQNMRLALVRWAGLAGWTFNAEHWSVDADIPIAGSAQFRSGFKQAVQALMAATELADRPLQPCFYSNKVLRIVPYAQPCNRVASLSGNS